MERHWKLAITVTGFHLMQRLFRRRREVGQESARGNAKAGMKALRQKQAPGAGQEEWQNEVGRKRPDKESLVGAFLSLLFFFLSSKCLTQNSHIGHLGGSVG